MVVVEENCWEPELGKGQKESVKGNEFEIFCLFFLIVKEQIPEIYPLNKFLSVRYSINCKRNIVQQISNFLAWLSFMPVEQQLLLSLPQALATTVLLSASGSSALVGT